MIQPTIEAYRKNTPLDFFEINDSLSVIEIINSFTDQLVFVICDIKLRFRESKQKSLTVLT